MTPIGCARIRRYAGWSANGDHRVCRLDQPDGPLRDRVADAAENLAALADLPGEWIDKVHRRRPPRVIVLDMDSSESPTYGEQEGSAYNGHFGCTLLSPLFVFNGPGQTAVFGVSCPRPARFTVARGC